MRAIGYVRVSTAKQADKGVSLEAQKEKIRAYCALKDMCLTEIVSDAGISGCRTARSGYQKVLAVCGRADVDAVVVYSLSRFTRSTKDLLDFVDTYVSKRGMSLHSLSENLDTGTPTGRFMLKVMAAMNELEREQIGQRLPLSTSLTKGKRQAEIVLLDTALVEMERLLLKTHVSRRLSR
jgi:site-specific DNA recombinase